jgi:hypothetical protein
MKKLFKIEITETLQRVVEVEALNIETAIEMITQKYNSEEIVLDYSDFLDSTIKLKDF